MSKEQESFDRIKLFIDHMNDDFDSEDVSAVDNALERLEEIDNADPSEAIKHMEFICKILKEKGIDVKWVFKEDYTTIIHALLKAQEPKQYLKWEDLEFKGTKQTMKVLLNGKEYSLSYFIDSNYRFVDLYTNDNRFLMCRCVNCYPTDVQFFNDLHLERVEE